MDVVISAYFSEHHEPQNEKRSSRVDEDLGRRFEPRPPDGAEGNEEKENLTALHQQEEVRKTEQDEAETASPLQALAAESSSYEKFVKDDTEGPENKECSDIARPLIGSVRC